MKFSDLQWQPHPAHELHPDYEEAKQAFVHFPNGHSVSVLSGRCFKSNGRNSFEVGIMYRGHLFHTLGYKSPNGVCKLLRRIAKEDSQCFLA